jgi:excisionase family DNA binding protein
MVASERWVGAEDVADHLGVAKDSVYRWIEERDLPAHRVGRLFRFKLSEIDEWVRQDSQRDKGQSRGSTKSKTNQSSPKSRSRKRGGNE